jgi:electron transport complex protein RnfE
MNTAVERLYNGIIKENTTYVQVLAMCPTLAVTTSVENAIGMGLATTAVLMLSNMAISAIRKVIPDKIRIPAFVVVIASFVTLIQFLLQGFVPSLYKSLGLFIPLIVVNCVILGRAEAYASKNKVIPSLFSRYSYFHFYCF